MLVLLLFVLGAWILRVVRSTRALYGFLMPRVWLVAVGDTSSLTSRMVSLPWADGAGSGGDSTDPATWATRGK